MKLIRLLFVGCLLGTAAFTVRDDNVQASAPQLIGKSCKGAGTIRTVKGFSYVCAKSGRSLKWKRTKQGAGSANKRTTGTSTPSASSTTTLVSKPCRTNSQITGRLPNELQKREWALVVEQLQPLVASADQTRRTTAAIDTFEDPQTGTLNYGRYYPMGYPAAIDETQGRGCTYLALVFGLMVRFTGSDTSDDTAKAGIQAAIKLLLQESLAKHSKVDGYDVDVILIEPVLEHCPGRTLMGSRSQCPWNDYGFLYFRTAALTAARVAATPANEIFSLSAKGATFPPRPFEQIVGIAPSTRAVEAGSTREIVPAGNKSHQASTYVEFSAQTYELGQSISVDSALPVASITVRTVAHVSVVDGRPTSGVGAGVAANIQTRIYRYNGSGEIPPATRRSDFSLQVDASQAVTFPHNSSVTFNLPGGIVLSPGKYLITFSVSGWNPAGAYIRLESLAEGNAGQTNAYVSGRAYRACNLRERIGYRMSDNPRVASIGEDPVGLDCGLFYAELSKGENPARPMQHTFVWSDIALMLNAP